MKCGLLLLFSFSIATGAVGAAFIGLALSVVLLPSETAFLGMSSSRLCRVDHCRLLNFIAHGRMSYGGALVAIGVMTGWLASRPLRRGEAWAWWSIGFAAITTYVSALAFLLYGGFFDWGYALFIVVWLSAGVAGLALIKPSMPSEALISSFRTPRWRDWTRNPEGAGRLALTFLGLSIIAAGVGIWAIASSVVFVPQDLSFLEFDTHRISAVSDKLMPLLSHDRVGYGGSMVALGALFAATAWKSLDAADQGAWRVFFASGVTFYASTIVIHFAIGYTNLVHLMPVYAGLFSLLVGLATVRVFGSPSRSETASGETLRATIS